MLHYHMRMHTDGNNGQEPRMAKSRLAPTIYHMHHAQQHRPRPGCRPHTYVHIATTAKSRARPRAGEPRPGPMPARLSPEALIDRRAALNAEKLNSHGKFVTALDIAALSGNRAMIQALEDAAARLSRGGPFPGSCQAEPGSPEQTPRSGPKPNR